jgi:hypothetical protein
MRLMLPPVYLLPEDIKPITCLCEQFSRPGSPTIWRRISQYHSGRSEWIIVTRDHIGDVCDISTNSEASVMVNSLVGKLAFTSGQATHGCRVHGANAIQVE